MKLIFNHLIFRVACFTVLLCLVAALPSRAASLSLVDKGQSEYSIAIPTASDDAAENKAINLAANLLQTTLQKAAGAKLPIVAEGKLVADTTAIYLGKTLAAKQAGLSLNEISGWTTLETARGKDIFLVGNDGSSEIQKSFVYQGTFIPK